MKEDPLEAARPILEDSLRSVLPDPSAAPWIVNLVLSHLRVELAGQRIPPISRMWQEDQDRRIYELRGSGVPPCAIAERLGINRSTVFRACRRELRRKRAA